MCWRRIGRSGICTRTGRVRRIGRIIDMRTVGDWTTRVRTVGVAPVVRIVVRVVAVVGFGPIEPWRETKAPSEAAPERTPEPGMVVSAETSPSTKVPAVESSACKPSPEPTEPARVPPEPATVASEPAAESPESTPETSTAEPAAESSSTQSPAKSSAAGPTVESAPKPASAVEPATMTSATALSEGARRDHQ